MTTPLSPAAQAVVSKIAASDCIDRGAFYYRQVGAAALHTTANRTEDLIDGSTHLMFTEGVRAAGDLLERIAAEMEAPNA